MGKLISISVERGVNGTTIYWSTGVASQVYSEYFTNHDAAMVYVQGLTNLATTLGHRVACG